MANADVEIVVETVDKTTGPLKKVDASFGGLGRTVSALAVGGAIIAVGTQLARFAGAAILAASDVEEMQSKFNTVFGAQSDSVTSQLQEFADAANRSVYDLQGFAATLQDTFVPLGFARDKAAEMSVEVVKLVEDLASFNNLDSATVAMDLQSALVGNTETLRKYGVVASQSAIQQKALDDGIWDGVGAITAQEKAAAILAITYASTTDAQGDAIKTSDSFANQMKGLESSVKDVTVGIGNELMPAVTDVVAALTDVVKDTGPELVQIMKDLKPAIDDAAKATEEFLKYINSDSLRQFVEVMQFLWKFTLPGSTQEMKKLYDGLKEADPMWGHYAGQVEVVEENIGILSNTISGGLTSAFDANLERLQQAALETDDLSTATVTLTGYQDALRRQVEGNTAIQGTMTAELIKAKTIMEKELNPAIADSTSYYEDAYYAALDYNDAVGDVPVEKAVEDNATIAESVHVVYEQYEGVVGEIQKAWDRSDSLAKIWADLARAKAIEFRYRYVLEGGLPTPGGYQWPDDMPGANTIPDSYPDGWDDPDGPNGGYQEDPGGSDTEWPGPETDPTSNNRSSGTTNNFFGGNTASAGAIARAMAPRG